LIGWMLLIPAILIAMAAVSVIAWTYFTPTADPLMLLNISHEAIGTVMIVLGTTFALGVIGKVIQWLRWRTGHPITGLTIARWPWYLRLCEVLVLLALVQGWLAGYTGVQFEAGKWMTEKSRGAVVRELSQAEATDYLWRNVRMTADLAFCAASMWILFSSKLIVGRLHSYASGETHLRAGHR
jgi:hypothetical protein